MKKIILVMMLFGSCQTKGEYNTFETDVSSSRKPINILDTTNIGTSYSLLVRNRDTVYIHDTVWATTAAMEYMGYEYNSDSNTWIYIKHTTK